MKEFLKQKLCEEKAIEVINSCTTIEQLLTAESFLVLYLNKFGDINSFFDLRECLNIKMTEIKTK